MNKTTAVKKADIEQKWYVIDASGIRLGKLAVKCATVLIGKHKVARSDNLVCGDKIVVINSAKVDYFPGKETSKKYFNHSGFIGGMRERTLGDMLKKNPNEVIEIAVKGMLPKTKLGAQMYDNLYVYADDKHLHEGQNPVKLNIA